MQVLVRHFFCRILPVSVLGMEILSELDFSTKLFLWASMRIFVWLDSGKMSQCSYTNYYNVQREMVRGCVKWMHAADTSVGSAFACGNWGGDSRHRQQWGRSGSHCAVQSFVKKCSIQYISSMRWMGKWLNTVIVNPLKILSLFKYFDLPEHALVYRPSW